MTLAVIQDMYDSSNTFVGRAETYKKFKTFKIIKYLEAPPEAQQDEE